MLRYWIIWIVAIGLISVPPTAAIGTDDHFDDLATVGSDSRWQEELEKSFEELDRRLQKYGRDLEKLPERKEYRQLKNRMGEWAAEMERAGEDVREKIESHWLPKIRKELDAIEEWLRERTRKSRSDRIREV